MSKPMYRICIMKGDGIGPEIIDAALSVLKKGEERFGFKLEFIEVLAGDLALAKIGDPLPQASEQIFSTTDACLKGPVGETVMDINTKLRFGHDLYANIRPAVSFPSICPPALRPDIDLVVIRENSEGLYRAIEKEVEPGVWTTTGVFTSKGAKRLARLAFDYARNRVKTMERHRKVTLATKANIFRKTHGLYLEEFRKISAEYKDIEFEHCYADALCAKLVRNASDFDVIVAENLLGDLLSDLAGQVSGGLGLTPGTNMNYETKEGYFEPTHGSAPDIAGKGIANPIGQVRSAALMLEFLALEHADEILARASKAIESAIQKTLSGDRYSLPIELGGHAGTTQIANAICANLLSP